MRPPFQASCCTDQAWLVEGIFWALVACVSRRKGEHVSAGVLSVGLVEDGAAVVRILMGVRIVEATDSGERPESNGRMTGFSCISMTTCFTSRKRNRPVRGACRKHAACTWNGKKTSAGGGRTASCPAPRKSWRRVSPRPANGRESKGELQSFPPYSTEKLRKKEKRVGPAPVLTGANFTGIATGPCARRPTLSEREGCLLRKVDQKATLADLADSRVAAAGSLQPPVCAG